MADPSVERGTLTAREQRRNLESRDEWERFGPHRERVTALLREARFAASPQATLCLLGAGNLNDVDLPWLVESFASVHLVDLDGDAIRQGIARQLGERASGATIHIHDQLDLSGLFPALEAARIADGSQTPGGAKGLVRAALDARIELPGAPFDVVASLGTLSQILEAVQWATSHSPDSLELIQAARYRHLRLLLESTKAGGEALLVFEMVSSTTYPALPQCSLAELPALVARLIDQRNFFTGLNPAALRHLLETDERLRSLVGPIRLELPWLWDLGPRVYACTALRLKRGADPA